jgi:NarL family two-component system response regulator YdfI
LRARPALSDSSTSVLVVAADDVVAARLEAMLRSDHRLTVAVSGLGDLPHRLDGHDPAVVVLAVPPQRVAWTLEHLGGRPRIRAVIALAAEPHAIWTPETRRAGVRAALRSDVTSEELTAAITATSAGLVVLHPDIGTRSTATPSGSKEVGVTTLTPREIEILEMMAEGLSNRRIAGRLTISRHTVKFHVASILAKLAAGSRTEAVTTGVRLGLIAL